MAEKRWTVDAVLALHPCEENYPRERLEKLARGHAWNLREILSRRDIPPVDRVWFACQPGVLTKPQRDAWLTLVVTRIVTAHALHCRIPEVKSWASDWLSGTDRSSEAAWAAAGAAWVAGETARAAVAATVAAATVAAATVAAATVAAGAGAAATVAAATVAAGAAWVAGETAWAAEAAAWAAEAAARAAASAAWAARVAEYRKQLRDLRCVLKASETAREARRCG